jgi:hypothetical protein
MFDVTRRVPARYCSDVGPEGAGFAPWNDNNIDDGVASSRRNCVLQVHRILAVRVA